MSLAEILSPDALAEHLPPPGSWRPVPAVTDRDFWSGPARAAGNGLIEQAARRCDGGRPTLPASLWRDYARTGNRVRYEERYFARRDRLAAAVLAACCTDDDRWHDEVADGIWLLCEETSWCLPAHDWSVGDLPDPQRPYLDLFAAETGALLAWTHAVLAERLSPVTRARIRAEVLARVLVPQRTRDDWVWFGRHQEHVNNWNPWINANVLACSLLLDTASEDIVRTAERAVEGLQTFLNGYPPDGGCTEGAGYWWRAPASLYECLETLHSASGGALDAFGVPPLPQMGAYLYRVHIDGPWYVNVADGPARLDRDNADAHLAYRFGRRIGDTALADHGRAMRGEAGAIDPEAPAGRGLGRMLLALADTEWTDEPARPAPRVLQAWLPDTQLLVARQRAGSAEGLLVTLKGGHNAEDHNHNDVGTFSVALDGHLALIDVGVAEYTKEHFGPHRYDIWTLRSDYHNVPAIDGHEQAPGREFAARDVTAEVGEQTARMRLDLAGAYPDDVRHWWRELLLDRATGTATLTDTWELGRTPATLVSHLMTCGEPQIGPDRFLLPTPAGTLTVLFPGEEMTADAERIDLPEGRLRRTWGPSVWRISLTATAAQRTGRWVLRIVPPASLHEPHQAL